MNKNIFTRIALAGAALLGLTTAQALVEYGNVSSSEDYVQITTDTTWTKANHPYKLNTIVYVTNGADLTIEPGVVIQGIKDNDDGDTTDGKKDPGTLVITRGSKLLANGTPTEPIVFTGNRDQSVSTFNGTVNATWTSNNDQTELCGGVVVLGKTYVAVTANATTSGSATDGGQIEGLTILALGRYGGNPVDVPVGGTAQVLADDNDDSGEMSFWSIRYAGVVIGPANELNGLTLGGVGRNTDISHIEVVNPKDDGIEFFGGTVNTKYCAVINSGDDSIDWDMGFRGKGQYWFVVQGATTSASGSGLSDKIGELDGTDDSVNNAPFSVPTFFNCTLIGFGGPNETPAANGNQGLYFTAGGGGRFVNTLLMNIKGGGIYIRDEADADPGTTREPADLLNDSYATLDTDVTLGAFYDHADEGLNVLGFNAVELWNCGNILTAGSVNTQSNQYSGSLTGVTHLGNNTSARPITSLNQSISTTAATIYETVSVDPRPANSALTGGVNATDSFFDDVSYKGAFAPGKNWMAGWTISTRWGLVQGAATDTYESITGSRFAFEFDTVPGSWYVIESSTDLVTWTAIDSLQASAASTVYLDDVNLATKRFYRVYQF